MPYEQKDRLQINYTQNLIEKKNLIAKSKNVR